MYLRNPLTYQESVFYLHMPTIFWNITCPISRI